MKKLFALLLAAVMLLGCCALAEELPEGYPEIKEGVDFGGANLYIDYYWGPNPRKDDPSEEEQAQYDYRDWIMKTYNVNIVEEQLGDWGSISTELTNFVGASDGSLRVMVLPPDFVGGPMANGYLAAWNENDLINFEDDLWNDSTVDFMTVNGKVYGVATGNSEPRHCLYFNKSILEDAGIDWNTIYDMQADGTWTFEAFEEMLKKIQKDTDNDGVSDIWGMTGSNVDMYRVAVFANGGSFFDFDENGKLAVTAGSDNTLEALAWAKDVWNTYGYQQPADGAWDYFKQAWKQNFCGFYMYQTYGGFNDQDEFNPKDDGFEWGCVAFPVGPKGTTYTNVVSDNVYVIPNCYDAETVGKIAYIYSLWASATPGYDDEFAWIGNKYNKTDDRAVDETYAMLREPEHCSSDKVLYLGSINDVEGQDFLWNLGGSTPAELLEAKLPVWQTLLDAFNK
ncbi:MAG: hypothetical protein IJR97_05980 [Clostridia bacterium]|nr:hypothetical protein [Clostridia bacterium]